MDTTRFARRRGSALALVLPLIMAMSIVTVVLLHNSVRLRQAAAKENAKLAFEARRDESQQAIVRETLRAVEEGTGTMSQDTSAALAAMVGPTGASPISASISLIAPDILASSDLPQSIALPPGLRLALGSGTVVGRLFSAPISYSLRKTDALGGMAENEQNRTATLRILELPSQFAAEGEHIRVGTDVAFLGSALARRLTLASPVAPGHSAVAMAELSDDAGQLNMAEEASGLGAARATAKAGQRQVLDSVGKARLIPVGSRGPEIFSVPTGSGANSVFARYWHPYHQTHLRLAVRLSGTNSWTCTLSVADASLAGRSIGSLSGALGSYNSGVALVRRGTGGEHVSLSVSNLAASGFLAGDPLAIYVDAGTFFDSPGGARREVVVYDADTLPASGLSIVTASALHVGADVGINGAPFSLLAPEVRWGAPGWPAPRVTYAGRLTRVDGATRKEIGEMLDAFGSVIANKTVTLGDGSVSTLPPVVLRSWLVWIENW